MAGSAVDLYWLPLGAGGHFVRLNGRVYERIVARREGRAPLDLYHTALEVTVPEARFVIENSWPIPREEPARRGVVVQGPVGARAFARWRAFRYEIRCWQDGSIPDVAQAVASPQRLGDDDDELASRVLELAPAVPPSCGAATSSASARCGIQTRSSRGCWSAPAFPQVTSVLLRTGVRPAGGRASWPPPPRDGNPSRPRRAGQPYRPRPGVGGMDSKEVVHVRGPISLEQYKRAEQAVAANDGRRGLLVHFWITVVVVTGLVLVNILVASEFPWSIFPAAGMSIGVAFHYFGIRHLAEDLSTRQDAIEREATRLSA